MLKHFLSGLRFLASSLTLSPGQRGAYEDGTLDARALYEMLEMFYQSNGLYEYTQQTIKDQDLWGRERKPLRNPTYRAVEFYPMKLWPGTLPDALPITAENEALIPAIEQLWLWSNWGSQKQVAARWLAMYGDLFIYVATHADDDTGEPSRVFLQLINPKHVIDFDVDERGVVTYARIDVTVQARDEDVASTYTSTEVWSLDAGYRRWAHERGIGAELEQLGPADEKLDLAEFGIDFVPLVHAKFVDEGELRGAACIMPVYDKVNEVNAMATRLHQMSYRYNKPYMVLSGQGRDAQGRPLPALSLKDSDGTKMNSSEALILEDDALVRLPGDAKMESLVPNLDYGSMLETIDAQLREIEKDLPELRYANLAESNTDMSGRALRVLLTPAIDKCLEVRGNAETALVRAQKMALTMGQNYKLWTGLGTYEEGAFEHRFTPRDVIPITAQEQAETVKTYVDMGVPLGKALVRWGGWSEKDAGELLPVEVGDKTPEQEVAEQEVLANRAEAQLEGKVDVAMKAVADGALASLLKSGALDKLKGDSNASE